MGKLYSVGCNEGPEGNDAGIKFDSVGNGSFDLVVRNTTERFRTRAT